jgi:hypothetical protein
LYQLYALAVWGSEFDEDGVQGGAEGAEIDAIPESYSVIV